MNIVPLKLDNDVLKLKDPRITLVKQGKMPLQTLVKTIDMQDWLILLNGTVYTLSPIQYMAIQNPQTILTMDRVQFQQAVHGRYRDQLNAQDNAKFDKVAAQIKRCSVCTYKRYKAQVEKLLLQKGLLAKSQLVLNKVRPYPEYTDQIQNKVTNIRSIQYQPDSVQRTPCLDCVRKHLGQARILSTQAIMGYPQHYILALSHLQQAYDEAPVQAKQLKQLLLYCIAKSVQDRIAFVPLGCLLRQVQLYAATLPAQDIALNPNKLQESLALDFSPQQQMLLRSISGAFRDKVLNLLVEQSKTIQQYKIKATTELSAQWAGIMATLSQQLSCIDNGIGSILRNRRLLFKSQPDLIEQAGLGCSVIYQLMTT